MMTDPQFRPYVAPLDDTGLETAIAGAIDAAPPDATGAETAASIMLLLRDQRLTPSAVAEREFDSSYSWMDERD